MKKIISLIFYIICSLIFILEICVANEKAISIPAIKNPKAADSNSISRGKMHYMERCSICHGEKADGNGPSAESFEIPPWEFTEGALDNISAGYLFQKIKNGGIWFEMPSFGLILKDDDIWDIINYLKFISKSSK